MLTQPNLRLQLRIFYIAESILNFDAVHATIALKDKIQIMPCPRPLSTQISVCVPALQNKLLLCETFQDDQFSVTTNCSAQVRRRVFLNQIHNSTSGPSIVTVPAMPE